MAAFNRRPQIDELLMENSINDGVNARNGERVRELPGQAIVQPRNIGIIVGRNETIILSRLTDFTPATIYRRQNRERIHRD